MSVLALKLIDNCDCPLIMHRLTSLFVLLMIVFLYKMVWFKNLWLLILHTTLIATALVLLIIIGIFFAVMLYITFLRVSVLLLSVAVTVVFVFIRDRIQFLMIIWDIYLGHVKTTCIKIQWNLQWIRRRCLHNNIFQLFFCFATNRLSLLNCLFLRLA